MTAAPATVASSALVATVRRNTRTSYAGAVVLLGLLVFLGFGPYNIDRGMQQNLVGLFALVVLGTMWNLLAGYGGMISIGQQAYVGIGAYALVYLADTVGLNPFLAVPAAVVITGAISVPISFLAFRLHGGYFAIGTWVIAEVILIVTTQIQQLGAGSGISLTAFSGLKPVYRIAYVYWLSLVAVVTAILVTYAVMRSRLGLAFTAIRDDAVAASSLGVQVTRARRLVFVISAMGCGLGGAMIASNTLRVQPESIYSVRWAAYMIFIVVIGGLGTIEGPILGAVVFWALQNWLSDLGSWYLVILGVLAAAITLFAPTGLWGLVSGRGRLRLFPVGYRLVAPRSPATAANPSTAASPSTAANPSTAPNPTHPAESTVEAT